MGKAQSRQTHCKRGHEFTPENTYVTSQGGRSCRACSTIKSREFEERHRDSRSYSVRGNPTKSQLYCLTSKLKKHGLTVEDYNRMLARQGGVCAICGEGNFERQEGKDTRRLELDHDHATNVARELLCGSCNRGLGLFKDDSEKLQKAAEYLRRHREIAALERLVIA
jgi:hypothetical protein